MEILYEGLFDFDETAEYRIALLKECLVLFIFRDL